MEALNQPCSWKKERDRLGRTRRRPADGSQACILQTFQFFSLVRGSFRRDADKSGRDAARSPDNYIVLISIVSLPLPIEFDFLLLSRATASVTRERRSRPGTKPNTDYENKSDH